jgi:hypothetical protein
VKPVLVQILNFITRVYRIIKSYLRFAFRVTETIFCGYRHAWLVHKHGLVPDTLLIVHAVNDDAGDQEKFFGQLANEISKHTDCPDIDLVLIANDTQPVTAYTALARMFGRRLNVQIYSDARALAGVGIAAPSIPNERAHAGSLGQVQLSEKAAGCLRPPLMSKNAAREYLKSIDPTGRFCAVSFPATGCPIEAKSTLVELAKRNSNWRFVVLNDLIAVNGSFGELPPEILTPSRAGFDSLTRLCLAVEADAYIGAADVYGLAAYLARKPAHLLGGGRLPVAIGAASSHLPATEIERLAVDLFGAKALG